MVLGNFIFLSSCEKQINSLTYEDNTKETLIDYIRQS